MGIQKVLDLVIHFFRVTLQMSLIQSMNSRLVKDGLHPVLMSFLVNGLGARQIADINSSLLGRVGRETSTRHMYFFSSERVLQQPCRQGQKGFSCAGGPYQRHHGNPVVQKQVQGEKLFPVKVPDTPGFRFLEPKGLGFLCSFPVNPQGRLALVDVALQEQKLVFIKGPFGEIFQR